MESNKKQSSVNNKEEQPSKAPKSAKEMFLAEPKPDVVGKVPIVKLTQEQLKEILSGHIDESANPQSLGVYKQGIEDFEQLLLGFL